MNVIVNNTVAKLAVAFVAVAMLFTFAAPAKAQTLEELQAQIAALMAQIAALTGGGGGTAACTFTRSLTIGSQGADVTCLQDYLTSTGHFNFSGGSTGYFGPITQSAVAAWQAANGVAPAVGYFGPISQAKYTELAATMGDDDDDDDAGTGDVVLRGEASLGTDDLDDAEDDELEEGQEDREIGLYTVEFDNGDALITRLDVALAGTGDETDPWDTFSEISLWVDGDKVAEFDATDEDDYLDEDTGEIRFAGLSIFAEEDEEVEISIAASVQNSVDGASDGEAWTVDVLEMRYVDGDDVTTTETIDETAVSFSIVEEGTDDELIVKTSTSDPTSDTLILEDDSDSDWLTLFAFDLDTDDSVNDIELNEVPVTVNVSSSTVDTLFDDFELVIDGVTIDDWTYDAGADDASRILTFDVDGDVVIDAGDRVTVELMVQFNALATGNEGVTASGTVTSANADAIDAEGADDLGTSQLSGSATGDDHTLRTSGLVIDVSSVEFDTSTSGDNDTIGIFTIEFQAEAFEGDFYVAEFASTTGVTGAGTGGLGYSIDGPGSPTSSGALTSTGDEDTSGVFTVREGEKETFTLTVTVDASVSGLHRVTLGEFVFSEDSDGVTGSEVTTLTPASDYRTPYEQINAS